TKLTFVPSTCTFWYPRSSSAPTNAVVMTSSLQVIETSIVRSSGSEYTPHLNPVSHQCGSGPRQNSFSPLRFSVDDMTSSSSSVGQSKKRLCWGFASPGRWPIVASSSGYGNDDEPATRL